MQFDWITVSAQIVNFLVLVYLLQHFLYKPVIRAMDRRETRIADRLGEAEQRETEAREQIETCRDRERRLESERQSLVDSYRREAREEKQRLLDSARREVEETRSHWQRQANQEKRDFLENLQRRAEQLVSEIAGKALADLADSSLEARVVEVFIDRLKSLDRDGIEVFAGGDGKLRVTTAYELDAGQRRRITRAVHERIDPEIDVEYGEDADLVCGIRLGDDGHAIDWNLSDYVSQVSERMDRAIDEALRRS